MTLDRDQIRRDAEKLAEWHGEIPAAWARGVAESCHALLTELEQAERQRDGARLALESNATLILDLEARLAKVPPLIEALTRIARHGDYETEDQTISDEVSELADIAREALAAWETE